ncbi:MAG: hypothetical protein EHM19_03990 [Candidatus Latescibacterota bacterium]|nr:MAG: hypothetical protein EHM19_03990 [Candidatus Latescibacterota bacterium]
MGSEGRQPSTLIQITAGGMGQGPPELRMKLVLTYLSLLDKNGLFPGAIAFFTDAVRLVTEGSPALDVLLSLESKGVHLVICKTCLESYGLVDKVRVGTIGGMTDILSAQWKAEKIINI